MNQTILLGNAKLHIINTKKFKNNTISIKMMSELSKESTTLRTLLSFCFSGGTKKIPTQQALTKYLEDLYGMRLGASISSKGKAHIININSVCVNGEYLPYKKNLLESQLSLLHDVLFELNNDGQSIDEALFNLKKREVKQRLISLKNDKYSYALEELFKIMGEDECLGISSTGYEDQIDSITKEELYQYYQKSLKNDKFEIYAVGDFKESDIELFKKYLTIQNEPVTNDVIAIYSNKRDEILNKEEIQELTQAKLNIGFEVNTSFIDEDNNAFTVFNGMFGGFAHSRLFKVIREENSLCYYISSSYDPFNTIMVVTAGIDGTKKDIVVDFVNQELIKFQNGDISLNDFEVTKSMLVNGIRKSNDEAGNIIALKYNRDIVNKEESIDDYIANIEKVTIDQIKKVANKVKLDTVFLLKGGNEE